MGTRLSGKAQIHTNGTSLAHPMLHHYIVSCTPNLSSWGPSFNFSAPVWIPVNTAGEWWLRSTKYNAKYSPRRKWLQKYKNSQYIIFDKKKTKRVSTKSASQPVGHLGNSLCSCSHLSSHLCVGKLKFKYCVGIVNLTLKELKYNNSVEILGKVLKYVLKCCGPCLYTDPPSYTMY